MIIVFSVIIFTIFLVFVIKKIIKNNKTENEKYVKQDDDIE